jgi:hypothetical protein
MIHATSNGSFQNANLICNTDGRLEAISPPTNLAKYRAFLNVSVTFSHDLKDSDLDKKISIDQTHVPND